MQYPLFRRKYVNFPLRVWSGVFVRKRMSGEWSSSMVTMSEREGLFAPAFCAFIVRSVRLVVVRGAAAGDCACPALTRVPCGVVGKSVYVGLAESEASVRSLPCWVDIPGGVIVCPFEDTDSSSGCGEPGGEWGKGYGVSLLRSGRMTKVGSGYHPMLCRLLGRRRERGSPGGRTGNESGMRVGQ